MIRVIIGLAMVLLLSPVQGWAAFQGFASSGNTEYLNRDGATAINSMSAYTRMMWVYIDTDRNDYSDLFFSHASGSANNHDYDEAYLDADGMTLASSSDNGTTFQAVTGTTLSTGTWYHIAIVRNSASDMRVYLNGVQDSQITLNMAGRPTTDQNAIFSGYPGFSQNAVAGRWMAYKDWTTNLSPSEIATEMTCITPIKTASLWSYLLANQGTTAAHAQDQSGNARHYTVNGASPTVNNSSAPTFTCAATAKALMLMGVGQ